jgi:hypothetical protein
MKKMKVLILLMIIVFPICNAAAVETPLLIDVYALTEIPDFLTGPMADVFVFPWAIPIGKGLYNYLGLGAAGGTYIMNNYLGINICPIIQGVFLARFMGVKDIPIDWEVRLGGFFGPYGSALVAMTCIAFNFKITSGLFLRLDVGYNIFPGYDPVSGIDRIMHSLALGLGISIPLKGLNATEVFKR